MNNNKVNAREDQELISLIVAGDKRAFRDIFDRYYTSICFFINNYTNNLEDAEDRAQDLFSKLWNSRTDLSQVNNLKAYLYTSARNSAIDFVRRKKAFSSSIDEVADQNILQSQENMLLREEALRLVIHEMQLLPGKYRHLLQALYFDGESYAEISARLQVPEATLRKQKERALELLKSALLKKGMSLESLILVSIIFS